MMCAPPLHLQPENLLLASKTKGASVKLADFGLAVEAMDGKYYYGENCVTTSSLPPSLPLYHCVCLALGKSITVNLEALVDKYTCMCPPSLPPSLPSSLPSSLPPSLSLCLPSFGKDNTLLLVSITVNLEALVDKYNYVYTYTYNCYCRASFLPTLSALG